MFRKKVVILGSTGSIGVQALELIEKNPDLFEVVGLAANGSEEVYKQAEKFGVKEEQVVLAKKDGFEKVNELARIDSDVVLNSITGSIGLEPTLEVLKNSSATLALANKESLVAGGNLIKELLDENVLKRIIPVDSEHSAVYQALDSARGSKISKLLLTASGGPFYKQIINNELDFESITPELALKHPNWNMGKVISINSATLMNKALELVEACYLFNLEPKDIEVVIHPTSIVHSGIKLDDGSLILQASIPDMKIPIALGINQGKRIENTIPELDLTKGLSLEFEPADENIFQFLKFAKNCFNSGQLHLVVFNAANEIAVDKFLNKQIKFNEIYAEVLKKVEEFNSNEFAKYSQTPDLELIKLVEKWARCNDG